LNEHKSMLCVGGPRAGERFESHHGSGFRVPILRELPDAISTDYRSIKETVEIAFTDYHEQTFHTPQGDVSFWVPIDQTPLETITLLLEAYERQLSPRREA